MSIKPSSQHITAISAGDAPATASNMGQNEPIPAKSWGKSYEGRSKPSMMQQQAQRAPFMNRKGTEAPMVRPIIILEKTDGKKLKENVKPNPSLDSHLGNVLRPSEDYSDVEPIVIDEEAQASAGTGDLIGGQDIPDDERYRTNTKRQMNGERMPAKRQGGLKRVERKVPRGAPPPSIQEISPITGLKIADYGSWVQDAARSKMEAAVRKHEEALLKEQAEYEEAMENPIMRKLKHTLKNRGASGLAGLARRFRIMDDDNTGDLSRAEFRKAMRECKMGISDSEVTELFGLFDDDNSGGISYNEFISHLAGELNMRRRKLVDLAFKIMDKDGNGVIELDDVAAAYDVSKHPQFLSGERTKESILAEFLSAFDVGGEKDGKVTPQEFRNYYRNISASIDSDDYFELMIRNAWHISGGEGLAANSSNIRVLVTHSDGTQSVQGLLNDIGVNPANKKEVVRRLRAQGVDVMAIPGYTDKRGSPAAVAAAAAGDGLGKADMAPAKKKGGFHKGSTSTVESLRAQVAKANKKHGTLSEDELPLLSALRDALKKRGANGFNGLQRSFRIMDDDGSRFLDRNEFKNAMHDMNILLTDTQLGDLFDFFDKDQSNTISYDEFILGLRGEMSERRKKLVMMAFDVLDADGNGVVEPSDIAAKYDASRHPAVLTGAKTPDAVLREFLDTFDVGGEVDGKVTKEEFTNYYNNISASIDDDDYFELMIRNAWHISGGKGAAANSANRRVLVTNKDGSTSVQEIKSDLGLKADDKEGMMRRLKAQGIDAAKIDLYGGVDDDDAKKAKAKPVLHSHNVQRAPPVQRAVPSLPQALDVGPGGGDEALPPAQSGRVATGPSTRGIASSKGPSPRALQTAQYQGAPQAAPNVLVTINKVKKELKSRGAHGFTGMQRRFRTMDKDNNKVLTFNELKYGLREMRLRLSDEEITSLIAAVDRDGSGKIEFEEFVQMLREPLSERRRKLVNMAFSVIDKDGNGIVDAAEVATCYNALKHPEVIAGSKTAEQVFTEFLDTFDVGGEVDGKVTKEEFTNYYNNISASIDDDDYFELMIRNAWHISGGKGAAANSANRRVLVTDSSGRQFVQEIKNDLGLAQDDKAGMIARLKAQGVNVAKIDSAGKVEEDNTGASAVPANVRRAAPARATSTVPSSGDEGVPPSPHGSIHDPVEEISVLQAKALKYFNKYSYADALHTFELVLALQTDYYKHPRHPEVLKTQKSITLCEKKAVELANRAYRAPMKEKRRNLVHMAFNKLDIDGNGIIDIEEMMNAYDASKHPAVIAGSKSAREVMQELLDTFDIGGEVDSKVTFEEFSNYYNQMSVTIDNDDYFELMIRNAWHISGGEGQAANSANRRVLVTHADGSQSVQEITDDLGIGADDKAGIVKQLKKQGVDVEKVELFGAGDNKQKQAESPLRGSLRARSKHSSRSPRVEVLQGGDEPLPPSQPMAGKSVPADKAIATKREEGLKLFNAGSFLEAKEVFEQVRDLLMKKFTSKLHPEVFKVNKTIELCQKKFDL